MSKIKNLRITNPNKLLEVLEINGVPEISAVINKLNIQIKNLNYNDLDEIQYAYFGTMKGSIYISNQTFGSERLMTISDSLSFEAKRFTSAYMLALSQLKSDSKGNIFEILFDESIYDREVYNYAMDLLIPDKLFEEEDLSNISYIELIKKYKVSKFLIEEKIKRKEKQKNKKFEVIK